MCCALCGCSKSETADITPITNGFKCDFSIKDSDLSGELSVNQDGYLTVIFSGPDIINGTSISVKEEIIIIEVQGVTEQYARSTVPDDSPALYIYDALLAADGIEPEIIDDEIQISGICRSGDFTAVLSGTGFLNSITLQDTGTTLSFRNPVRIN